MNIASAPFLFLFLPAVIIVYYLIPSRNSLFYRNIFLVASSLFFYIWGEPIFIFLLLAMILLTWLFGKIAFDYKNSKKGKIAIFLTVIINLLILLYFGKNEFLLNLVGKIFNKDFSFLVSDLPIGFSFFIFSSISYVVDIYRGRCQKAGTILDVALYTCLFFRILQGPIITYKNFENQINDRKQSFDSISNGIYRFSIGLSKKVIIANNLLSLVNLLSSATDLQLSLLEAWLWCISYLIYMYFDFSGYSDMAIGLAEIFGFSIPENFNYPYISISVSDFWKRWHITLYNWFQEYLYYPIMLGPSIRLRKYLQMHNIENKLAQKLQIVFVTVVVWIATSLWHGMNLKYFIWGILNCIGLLIEPYIKSKGNKRFNNIIRHIEFLLFLFISLPLTCANSLKQVLQIYKSMLFGSFNYSFLFNYCIKYYGFFLIFGIIGCFPILQYLKQIFYIKIDKKYHYIWDICSTVAIFVILLISISFILTGSNVDFLYQQ